MDVREEILDYINRNELTGALLLTGPWGCGKSYLVKEIAKELNNSKKAAVATISLFGLDSVAAINKRVKDEYVGFMLGGIGKTARKVSKTVGELAKDGATVASIATNGNPGLSAVSNGIASVMAYNPFDFIEVKKTVGKDKKERNFILVFDDLERSNLTKKDLLGALNEYEENKQIRVIIVADEEKIESEDYKEYKEKLISRTIRMAADYGALIDQIVEAYSETSTGYKAFLEENRDLIKQFFSESKSFNLRTLKSALADFERVYAAWQETDIATANMKWALYTFAAEMFVSKVPTVKENEDNKRYSALLLAPEEKQYIYRGKKQSSFYAFTKWISHGEWDKELFIQELHEKYTEANRSPLERILQYSLWSLEQKDIDTGLPEAIGQAYQGKLSRRNLIYLLTKIHTLRELSVPLPCEIDYTRMEAGLKERNKGIMQGTIDEPPCNTFAMGDQIDEEARPFYSMIERMDEQIAAWESRRQFIDYLNGESDSTSRFRRGQYLEEFDDELLRVFKKRYASASNEDKREYAKSLLGIAFDSHEYSTEENMDTTRLNLKELLEWLVSQKSNDGITLAINKQFIQQLEDHDMMKTENKQ